MQIAIVTETWPPEVNGVALTVHALAQGLARLGHAVEVVRPRQACEHEAALAAQGMHSRVVRGMDVPRYPGLRFGVARPHLLRRSWQARRPDAIYIATEGPLGHSALAAARALGIPACTGFHTRFDRFARHYGVGWLTPLVFACLRRFHNHAEATLVPTTELAAFLEDHGFRNTRLLRRSVDTDLFHPGRRDGTLRTLWGLADDDIAVLHVGRLAPEKNLGLALRAFDAIRERQPGARLVLVGDGPERASLEARRPDVVFSGMRREVDLARHYASGDLFLFPSLTETFGNVTLEALASGVPVVAFDYGAARDHLRAPAAGRRVACGDEKAFVAAAVDLSTQCSRASSDMRGRAIARSMVERQSTAEVASHFADLLAELAIGKAA